MFLEPRAKDVGHVFEGDFGSLVVEVVRLQEVEMWVLGGVFRNITSVNFPIA
jgi:hypothetical protein